MGDDFWRAFLAFAALLLFVAVGVLVAAVAVFVFDADQRRGDPLFGRDWG